MFLQLHAPESFKSEHNYREKRQTLLEIACGAAKNKFPDLIKVIGIGIDAPKLAGGINSEDFILLECESWSDETRVYYENKNHELKFFGTTALRQHKDTVTQFVPP